MGTVGKKWPVESKIWSLDDVRGILPEIRKLTSTAVKEFSLLSRDLASKIHPENVMEQKEGELQAVVSEWALTITKLGAEVKGMWLVDFDNGSGYYCWKFGETDIGYEHPYDSGFAGRMPIDETKNPSGETEI